MFFTMLKNDLKIKKGLNIILFLFIAAASVLMFVSTSQLYMQITGSKRTSERCQTSDFIILMTQNAERREINAQNLTNLIQENAGIQSFHRSEALKNEAVQIDFENVDENDQESFFENEQLLARQPRICDLTYDLNDQPFYVQNGTVRISNRMRDVTGAKTGDTVRIITPMGRVYEFEIAGFYKDPYADYIFRYLLSDDDYAVLAEDYPLKTDVFSLKRSEQNSERFSSFVAGFYTLLEGTQLTTADFTGYMSDDSVVSYLVACAIILISLFMLAIILMTIRFTMASALRDEEKEIGMMRAMGIDSLKFRWLFAAKYIAFAIAGGIIGIAAGLPLSRKVMQMFSGSIILPQTYELILVGTGSALLMTAAIILFCMAVMRRINRISVIDAIHGENRGERFSKIPALFLHRRSKMPVACFLGISDILTHAKRYIFLVIAYTLGGALILQTSFLYHSVMNEDFMKYAMVYTMDFFPDFSDEMMKDYENKSLAQNTSFWGVFNHELEENGIAAHVDTFLENHGYLLTGGRTEAYVRFRFEAPEQIVYCEGKAPLLENEAALSSYTARRRGIQVGDEIALELDEYTEDKLGTQHNEKKVIVTGLFDFVEGNLPTVVMGQAYDAGANSFTGYTAVRITGADKQAELDKLNALFAGHLLTGKEELQRLLSAYDLPLRLLRDVVTGTVILINILLTMLYMSIFLSEDKAEIALQRCIGFGDSKIKTAQLIRMLLLTAFAVLTAIALTYLAGSSVFSVLFSFIGLSGFRFLPMPLLTWVGMPLITLLTVMIPTLIRLKNIDRIDIGSIAEE